MRSSIPSDRAGSGRDPRSTSLSATSRRTFGVREIRCVSSCTAALMLRLRVLGIGPGDEVLVPTMTFVASANAVEHLGATPVFVDSQPRTGLVDLDAAEALITPRTKALLPVHLAGRPLDMDRVNDFRDRHGVAILEDAAHAIGAEWRGAKIGNHGNLTAFSFYVTKNITTIEGGALASADTDAAERVERLALHGLSLGAWQRFSDAGFKHYEVIEPGFKFNMTDVQAAMGLHQLKRIDEWMLRRDALWRGYDEGLASLPVMTPADPQQHERHARHLYTIEVGDDAPVTRDQLLGELLRYKIGTGVHYRAVHLHPYYREKYGLAPNDFPIANAISDCTLSLPLGRT